MSKELIVIKTLLNLNPLSSLLFDKNNQLIFVNKATYHHFPALRSVATQEKTIYFQTIFPLLPQNLPESSSYTTTMVCSTGKEEKKTKAKISIQKILPAYIVVTIDYLYDTDCSSISLANIHRQRIETLGQLAGGISHDFNNVLAGILGHVTYLKTVLPSLPDSDKYSESLNAIEQGAKAASIMTRQILNFSRTTDDKPPVHIDIIDICKNTTLLAKRSIGPKYNLILDNQTSQTPYILGIESHLVQVIINLIMNATEAMQEGGTIKVLIKDFNDQNLLRKLFHSNDLPANKYIQISVIDEGEGISPDDIINIFEPYYTTKTSGTGLGLPTVKEIVESLGGTVSIKSKLNGGTTVTIILPVLTDTDYKTIKNTEEVKEIHPSSGNILIVDDEYTVRNVLAMSLKHFGYNVDIAASGEEAISLMSDKEKKYHLVIIDMLMPNMTGDQLFEKLKLIDNNIKALLISGYASEEAINKTLQSGALGFIAKPFTISELGSIVNKCLNQ